jgi:hypothetical protein
MKSMYQLKSEEQDGRRNSPRAQEAMKHSSVWIPVALKTR